MIAALAIARACGGWLIGTKAGRLVLMVAAALLALWAFGAWREGQGVQQERARIERQDNQAVERADEAERNTRRDPDDLDRSLREHRF